MASTSLLVMELLWPSKVLRANDYLNLAQPHEESIKEAHPNLLSSRDPEEGAGFDLRWQWSSREGSGQKEEELHNMTETMEETNQRIGLDSTDH